MITATPTTPEQAFLAAICERPDDEAPRLMYADWCDDHGDPERAEFIRVQMELERLRRSPDGFCPSCGATAARMHRLYCASFCLWRRERELIGVSSSHPNNLDQWAGPAFHPLLGWPRLEWYRRGFVEVVPCAAAAWLAHGPMLVRAAPLLRVHPTDLQPEQFRNTRGRRNWGWPDAIINGFFTRHRRELVVVVSSAESTTNLERARALDRLQSSIRSTAFGPHETEEDSHAAMSDALLSWARSEPITALSGSTRPAERPSGSG